MNQAQQLIDESQDLVRALARKIHSGLPPHIPYDDVLAYGQVGLAEAARSYVPDQGARFSTFAYYRIRGAIYDGLSKMSWTTPAARKAMQAEQLANDCLESETDIQQQHSDEWIVSSTDRLAMTYLTSQLEPISEDTAASNPADLVAKRELLNALMQLIEALPPPEGDLMRMAYYEGQSLTDIAEKLGKSKSWASRLHARTLDRLARSLQEMEVA